MGNDSVIFFVVLGWIVGAAVGLALLWWVIFSAVRAAGRKLALELLVTRPPAGSNPVATNVHQHEQP